MENDGGAVRIKDGVWSLAQGEVRGGNDGFGQAILGGGEVAEVSRVMLGGVGGAVRHGGRIPVLASRCEGLGARRVADAELHAGASHVRPG